MPAEPVHLAGLHGEQAHHGAVGLAPHLALLGQLDRAEAHFQGGGAFLLRPGVGQLQAVGSCAGLCLHLCVEAGGAVRQQPVVLRAHEQVHPLLLPALEQLRDVRFAVGHMDHFQPRVFPAQGLSLLKMLDPAVRLLLLDGQPEALPRTAEAFVAAHGVALPQQAQRQPPVTEQQAVVQQHAPLVHVVEAAQLRRTFLPGEVQFRRVADLEQAALGPV